MNQVSVMVQSFFEDYGRSVEASVPDGITPQYADTFMFAGPQGVQAVTLADFLKALPQRQRFFKAVGLTSSKIQALEETRLDERYILVKVSWLMQFDKDPRRPITEVISATYLLHQQEAKLKIVFQLDHQDFLQRVEALGLLPSKG